MEKENRGQKDIFISVYIIIATTYYSKTNSTEPRLIIKKLTRIMFQINRCFKQFVFQLLLLSVLLLFSIANSKQDEEFIVAGKMVLLDQPGLAISDPRNTIVEWSVKNVDLYDASKLLTECQKVCDKEEDFTTNLSSEFPCRFELCNYILSYALNKKEFVGILNQAAVERTYSVVNTLKMSSNEISIFGSGNLETQLSSHSLKIGADNSHFDKPIFDKFSSMVKFAIIVPITSKGTFRCIKYFTYI